MQQPTEEVFLVKQDPNTACNSTLEVTMHPEPIDESTLKPKHNSNLVTFCRQDKSNGEWTTQLTSQWVSINKILHSISAKRPKKLSFGSFNYPICSCQVLTNPDTEVMGPAIWLYALTDESE
jgi:hypothetical protein